jgi:hypothetical protein
MLHRSPSQLSWVAAGMTVVAGVALYLFTTSSARADDPQAVVHLQFCLYELREAKEDVRFIKGGLEEKERVAILGGIDDAIQKLKDTIIACGGKPDYIKPSQVPERPDFRHLRHAITVMKTAREQLKIQAGVPEANRTAGLEAIDKCLRHLDAALDHVK